MAELNQQPSNTGNKKQRIRKVAPKVDLTAMVDLAFLLITFFMLTTSLNKPHSLDIAMPDNTIENTQNMDERRVVSLLVSEGKVCWYQGSSDKPLTKPEWVTFKANELRSVLLKMKDMIPVMTEGKDMMVLIKPGQEARTQDIIHVMDEMKINDVKRYMLSKMSVKDKHILLTHN